VAAFGLTALALTMVAVILTVRNRQRSVWLQLASALGLTGSSVAAAMAVTGTIPEWCWWLWGLSAAHAAAGILVVHARLDARIAAKQKQPLPSRKPAFLAQAMLLALIPVALVKSPWLGAALLFSAAEHLWTLARLSHAEVVQTPLRTVGLRALALSIAYSTLLITGLW